MDGLERFKGREGSSSPAELAGVKRALRQNEGAAVSLAAALRGGETWQPELLVNIIPQLLAVLFCEELFGAQFYPPQHIAAVETLLTVIAGLVGEGDRLEATGAVAKLRMSDSIRFLQPGAMDAMLKGEVGEAPAEGLEPHHYVLQEYCPLIRFITQHAELLSAEALVDLQVLGELLLGRLPRGKEAVDADVFDEKEFSTVFGLELGVSTELYSCFALLLLRLIALKRGEFGRVLEGLRRRAYNENLYSLILLCDSCSYLARAPLLF